MSFTPHRVTQLITNLDRIATALERLADNHGTPTPHAEPKPAAPPALPRAIRNPNHRDIQF